MELLGVGLGVLTAVLWSAADIGATMAARRWRIFKVTFVTQTAGFLALFVWGIVASVFWHLPVSQSAIALSLLICLFTGGCAALGNFYFYRALETGPIALVSPLISANSICTLVLSLFILRQSLTTVQLGAIVLSILGVVLAATNPREIRSLVGTRGHSFLTKGVRWALIATLAFGVMNFGIGASATLSGWYLPVLWTRLFSICFLLLISRWKRNQRLKSVQSSARMPPRSEAAASSVVMTDSALRGSGTSLLERLSGLAAFDPEATVVERPSRWQRPLLALPPEIPVLGNASSRPDPRAHSGRSSSMMPLLEADLEDTLVIRPTRSYAPLHVAVDEPRPLHQRVPSQPATRAVPQDLASPYLLPAQDGPASESARRPLSLALPSLVELSQLRKPQASLLGMGVLLAIIAGIAENAAVLCFSLNTQVTTTGIAAAIASGSSLIVMLVGLWVYQERLNSNQVGGMLMFMSGLILLAFLQ